MVSNTLHAGGLHSGLAMATDTLESVHPMEQNDDWELWVSEDESTEGKQEDGDQSTDPTFFNLELDSEDGRPGGKHARVHPTPR